MTYTRLEHLKLVTTLRSGKKIEKMAYPNPAHVEASKSSAVRAENSEPYNIELETVSKEKRKEPMLCLIGVHKRLERPENRTNPTSLDWVGSVLPCPWFGSRSENYRLE